VTFRSGLVIRWGGAWIDLVILRGVCIVFDLSTCAWGRPYQYILL